MENRRLSLKNKKKTVTIVLPCVSLSVIPYTFTLLCWFVFILPPPVALQDYTGYVVVLYLSSTAIMFFFLIVYHYFFGIHFAICFFCLGWWWWWWEFVAILDVLIKDYELQNDCNVLFGIFFFMSYWYLLLLFSLRLVCLYTTKLFCIQSIQKRKEPSPTSVRALRTEHGFNWASGLKSTSNEPLITLFAL